MNIIHICVSIKIVQKRSCSCFPFDVPFIPEPHGAADQCPDHPAASNSFPISVCEVLAAGHLASQLLPRGVNMCVSC